MDNYLNIVTLVFFLLFFGLGVAASSWYYNDNPITVYKCLDGMWTKNKCNFSGDWIHVDVSNMSYSRAVEICKHEVGHEIFAEVCENNFSKCEGILK